MEFVDNSGHIFSLPSYDDKPIGYEFEENKYTFWIDSDTNALSIKNYYMRTINVLIPIDYSGCYKDNNTIDGNIDIAIECDSNVFSLVSSIDIQNMISKGLDIKDTIKISDTKKILTNKDLVVVHVTEKSKSGKDMDFALVPIYVIGYTEEPGTWSTNLLIRTTNKLRKLEGGDYKYYYVLHETDKQHKEIWYESFGKILYEFSDDAEYIVEYEESKMITNKYCSITVGGIFKSESEELTINGLNTGVSLPLDMFRSVYQTSFYNNVFDEQRYNEKLKEYLTNFMSIKGELGNFKSAENSIKWFGWGDKISVSKLLQTDNVIQSQYIKDHFTTSTGSNILESFDTFRNSTLLSIIVKLNTETGDLYDIDFNKEFYGEGNPKLENLINKLIPETIGKDKNEQIEYWKGYYDYTFYELGLKLSCLKYYYEKYFLPIHLSVNSASLQHKVYLNDIKFINKQNTQITEKNINIEDDNYDVEFPITGIQYFTEQVHFVDSGYHEYNSIGDNDKEDWYYLHDSCISVPIKFNKFDKYYNCTLLLEKHNKDYTKDHEYPYFMTVDYDFTIIDDIKIYDYYNKLIDLNNVNIAYKTHNDTTYSRYYKGLSSLIETVKNNNSYIVPIKLVDYEDSIKDSIYRYKVDLDNINIDKNSNKNNIDVVNVLRTLSEDQLYLTYKNANKDDNINPYIETTYKGHRYVVILPSISSSNVNVMNNDDITGKICVIPELNYKIQYKYSELEDFKVNDNQIENRILDKVHINFVPTSTLIYEDHFSFVQDKLRPRTQYRNFVIYPKNINKAINKNHDINYWLDNDFSIRLLVNNKWYRYDFKILLPELNMNIGTLQYKYWANSNNYLTPFSQLKSISKDRIEFNSFMWEPKLAITNEINYIDDLIKYVELYNLKYVDGTYIDNTGFYEYIKLGNQTIRLRSASKHKNFILDKKQLTSENVYVYLNENNIYILDEIGTEGIYDVSKYPNGDYLYQYEQQDSDMIDIFVFEDSTESNSILFIYDSDKNGYYMKRLSNDNEDNNNWIEDALGNRMFLSIGTVIHNSLDDFLDRYTQQTNITNNKYLNRIHIFDLMKVNNEQNDVLYLHDNILLRCGDLSFKHDRTDIKLDNTNLNNIFDSTKSIKDHKLYIFKDTDTNNNDNNIINSDIVDTSRDLELVDDWIHGSVNNIDESKLTCINSQYEYGYYVIRDKDYNDMVITSINALNNVISKSVYIGTAIYDTFNDFKNHKYIKLSDDFNKSIYKNNDNFVVEDENGVNLVHFKVKFLLQDGSEFELTNKNYVTFAKNIFDDPTSQYLVKVEFYYNKLVASVPNRFIKVDNDKVSEINGKYYTTIDNKDQEVIRRYDMGSSIDSNIYENQPGVHWYDIDTNLYEINQNKDKDKDVDIKEFLNKLNISPEKKTNEHLQRTGIVNDEVENFFIQDDTYTQQNENNPKNYSISNEVEYVNWLKKSIPVVKGRYKIEYTVSDNQESNIKMLVCVYDTESTYKIYTNHDEFELTGNEYKVEAHFVINSKDLVTNKSDASSAWIDPHVYKLSSSEQNNYSRVLYTPDQYDKEDCGTYTVHVKDENYDNKYRYGNNNSQTVVDMYNKFFNNVYYDFANVIDGQNIYDDKVKSSIDSDSAEKSMSDDDKKNIKFEHKREIIIEQKLKLDSYLDYDLYLMHDYEYWYVMFISRQTIDEARNIDDLNIRPDQIKMFLRDEDGNIEYKIDHVRSDNQFLPNRMKFESSNGINHFNTNDIIAVYLQNNNRLPVNSNIGSKWTISPMSIGINVDQNTTKSSAEMTILNGTKGDNYYRRGYYNVTCQYCIDRNTQKELVKKANIRIG